MAFCATLSFAFGSTYFENRRISIHIIPFFMYFSLFGSLWCLLCGFCHHVIYGQALVLMPHFSMPFVLSFLYMSLLSGALGYLCLITLIKNVGSVKASYATLLSPVIALIVSSIFERYVFGISTFIGLIMIVISRICLK